MTFWLFSGWLSSDGGGCEPRSVLREPNRKPSIQSPRRPFRGRTLRRVLRAVRPAAALDEPDGRGLAVAIKDGGSFSSGDLAGTWNIARFNDNPYAHRWFEKRLRG